MQLSDEEWKQRLTPEQYRTLREKATDAPFSGNLVHNETNGEYACAACNTIIFDSGTKFDSKSGWPSFYDARPGTVNLVADTTLGMERTEVICSTCGGHLGHLFDDAHDQPTGQRYCINSSALQFLPSKESEKP